MAAPLALLRALDDAGAHRIEVDVGGELLQVLVGLDHDRLVATLEQVSRFLMSPVEPLGVPQRDALHDFRKRDVGDLDLRVDVLCEARTRGS